MQVKLTVNNDLRVLPGVRALVHSTLIEVPLVRHAESLSQLVTAGVRNAIENAYSTGEVGAVKLTIHENGGRIEIRIRDYGLPQDIATLEARLHDAQSNAWFGSCHALDSVDEIHWLAFGPEGKALQLIKWVHDEHVADTSSPAELTKPAADVPLAPQQEYTIRRMLPGDAVQVSQLMYRTYGNTYFNEDVYYPARFAEQNRTGRLISIVAVGAKGDIAGHCALERTSAGPVAEIGQAAVDPAHRGRGLLDKMKAELERQAESLGLVAWFADAVTVHTFTQQSNARHGGRACGVDLAVSPKSESFRNITNELPQRLSCVVYFHWIKKAEPRTVYVPARHQMIVQDIYANLQCPIAFGEAATPATDQGSLTVVYESRGGIGTIRAAELGRDSALTIRHAVRDLVEQSRAEVVYVELPVQNAATPAVWESLESGGLGFIGIGPHFWMDGDVVKLAYLVEPLERKPIQTFEPFAERMVDYALAEQARVRGQ